MRVLNVSNAAPAYLPWGKASLPFGDVLGGVTCTSASPGVVTSVGYTPANGDVVSLSFTAGGSIPTGLTAGTPYFVVGASGQTFQLSATKGGPAINTSSTGSNLILKLLSAQQDGPVRPFKPTAGFVIANTSAGALVLQGAPDAAPGPYPTGPGAWVDIVSVPAGGFVGLDAFNYDWIRVKTSGTLALLQN